MVMTARHLAKRAPSLKYSSSRPRRPSRPLVVKSRSRYARRFDSVLSTPTDLKRFSQVPLDSSAASKPLPLATIAAEVLESRFRSMEHFLLRDWRGKGGDFTLPGACSAKPGQVTET